MNGHLITVEISIIGGAGQRVKFESAAFGENRLKSLNAEAVQSGSAV